MIQRQISLGNYKYLCEFYENGIDFQENLTKKFVALRNFELINNVIYDTDFYFIEQENYNKFLVKKNNLVFPIHINNIINYSKEFSKFNKYEISDINEIKYDIFDSSGNIANIKCDKVRIYNPTIEKDLDFVIHLDNNINDINFHYFCNLLSCYTKKCEKEIIINNVRYIEYVEILIPNIKYVFSRENKLYINEDINTIVNVNNEEIDTVSKYYNALYDQDSNMNLESSNKLYLNNLINTFFIRKDDDKYSKVFLNPEKYNYNANIINHSLDITLFPYDKENSKVVYELNSNVNPTETFFGHNNYFRLSSRMGFSDNTISLINEFEFPGKINTSNEDIGNAIHNNIGSSSNPITPDMYQVTNYYNKYFLTENIDYLETNDFIDEDIADIEGIRSTGFNIQIATDILFKNIVYESKINTDENELNFIYDFSFSLNNIVENWNQLSEILVARATFIDKRLNIIVNGNPVVITKEWFKYLVNDTSTNRVELNFIQQNNLINTNFMNVNNGFNFIENINCSVIEKTQDEKNEEIALLRQLKRQNNQSSKTKLIYKPIYFKVNDLQSIELRNGVIQNIGINLSEFMTKVNTFNLNINGYNVKEDSRNDIYVIFKINANLIEEDSGYFDILDDNFDYISSGEYIKY